MKSLPSESQPQPGLISIMMPAYNAARFIGSAVESVLAQTNPHWELIIVDDGSTDETAAVVACYPDPRIRVIHQENGGESVARNTALQHCRGEFLAFLDADDLYLPHHLEVTSRYLQTHPQHGGVYTDGYHIDSSGNRLQMLSSRRRGPFEGRLFEPLVRASDVFGPPLCVLLRLAPIRQHDLWYDPEIVIGPDWDFFTRYAAWETFGYLDEPTCRYRLHQTNITFQAGARKRMDSLARCREKAIKLPGFEECSVETRGAVFYDLLVNLLTGAPERQNVVTRWPEFQTLPKTEQARLFRLMASKALVEGNIIEHIDHWFEQSRRLNPADRRGALLWALYRLSPRLCLPLLRLRGAFQPAEAEPMTPGG